MERHRFEIQCRWEGDSKGQGNIEIPGGLRAQYAVPTTFGGAGGQSSPEELLLCSVGACVAITTAWICELKKLPLTRIEMRVEGWVDRDPTTRRLRFSEIHLTPTLYVQPGTAEPQREAIQQAVHEAESRCLISNSLREDIKYVIEPTVREGQTYQGGGLVRW